MTTQPEICLRGRVFKEEGFYLCEIPELGQMAQARTFNDVQLDAHRLVIEYFDIIRLCLPWRFVKMLHRLGVKIDSLESTQIRDIVINFTIDTTAASDRSPTELHFAYRIEPPEEEAAVTGNV